MSLSINFTKNLHNIEWIKRFSGGPPGAFLEKILPPTLPIEEGGLWVCDGVKFFPRDGIRDPEILGHSLLTITQNFSRNIEGIVVITLCKTSSLIEIVVYNL